MFTLYGFGKNFTAKCMISTTIGFLQFQGLLKSINCQSDDKRLIKGHVYNLADLEISVSNTL